MKKMLACLLCALLLLPPFAQAEALETFYSEDFQYQYILLEDGTAEITGYSGFAESLTVPAEIDGHTVTGIGDRAFSFCFNMAEVTLPDSVTSIGNYAFYGCGSLTLTVSRDSEAEQYCKENDLAYTYADGLN